MQETIKSNAVRGDCDVGVGLVDVIRDGPIGVIIVTRDIRKGPRIKRIISGVGMNGYRQNKTIQVFVVNSLRRTRRHMRRTVKRYAVRSDSNGWVRLQNLQPLHRRPVGHAVVIRDAVREAVTARDGIGTRVRGRRRSRTGVTHRDRIAVRQWQFGYRSSECAKHRSVGLRLPAIGRDRNRISLNLQSVHHRPVGHGVVIRDTAREVVAAGDVVGTHVGRRTRSRTRVTHRHGIAVRQRQPGYRSCECAEYRTVGLGFATIRCDRDRILLDLQSVHRCPIGHRVVAGAAAREAVAGCNVVITHVRRCRRSRTRVGNGDGVAVGKRCR